MSKLHDGFTPGRVLTVRGWRALWVLACTLAVGATLTAADNWRYVRTENFELFSQASEKKTKKLVTELEQFRASFITYFHLPPAHEPRVTVVLFDSDQRFTPFKPLYNGKPKEVAGYFIGGEDEAVIALNLDIEVDEESSPAETIFHEYVHMLLQTRGMKLPTWLNEGLAEVFSTCRVDGDKVVYGRGKQIYVDILGLSELMPISRLLAVTEESKEYNEESKAGIFYAQSWALAHFLVCGEDRTNAAKLAKFLALMDKGAADPEAAFTEAFGFNFDQLEQLLRNYLENGKYFVRRMPVPLLDFGDRVEFRYATDEERDLALLNLHWRVHRSAETTPAAVQLAERDPNAPRPQELLAVLAAVDRNVPLALTRWRRAAELGSTNAYVLVMAARTKLLELGGFMDPDERLRAADVVELREWLDRAVQLSPYYDEAWEMLAYVESRASSFRNEAVNGAQNRVAKMKDPNRTFLALAVIRWRTKDMETANDILKAVLESKTARREIKAYAQLLLRKFGLNAPAAGRTAPRAPRAAAASGSNESRPEVNQGRGDALVSERKPSSLAVKPSDLEDATSRPPPPPRAQPLRLPTEAAMFGENGATLPPLDNELAQRVGAAVGKGGSFPPSVDFRALTAYPDMQRKAGVTGEGRVRFTIDATGHPDNVRPWTSSTPEFGMAAVESVKQWRFIPAIKDGQAVSTYVELTLTFGM